MMNGGRAQINRGALNLLDMFTTGPGPQRVFLDDCFSAADLVSAGVVAYQHVPMAAKPGGVQARLQHQIAQVYGDMAHVTGWQLSFPHVALGFPVSPSRGGFDHQVLSLIACAWLADLGFVPETEVRWCDILTTCDTWNIEVGTTNPANMERHLGGGPERRFAVMPLEEWRDPIRFDHLCLHVFWPGYKYSRPAFERIANAGMVAAGGYDEDESEPD